MTRTLVLVSTLALLTSGCGLFLQTDPPGFDAGPLPDAGRFDAGTFDAGASDAGAGCAGGCDDGVECTIDACSSEGTCTHVADASLCSGPATQCLVVDCDLRLGCVWEPDDERCDDSIGCTDDRCVADEDVCLHVPIDRLCDEDEPGACDPSLGPGSGCRPTGCIDSTDCRLGPCHTSAVCENGLCVPTPANDGRSCATGIDCAPSGTCDRGVCGPQGDTCAPSTQCRSERCDYDAGACVREDTAAGDPCGDPAACERGTCDGEGSCTLQQEGCLDFPGDCVVAECRAGECMEFPVACGANQTCNPFSFGACDCNSGFVDCDNIASNGCECAGSCTASECNASPADGGVLTPDGGRPDAGRSDAGRPDASPGFCPISEQANAQGFCLDGATVYQDCDGDGCCDCDRGSGFCQDTGVPGVFTGVCLPNLLCVPPNCSAAAPCCPCTGMCSNTCTCAVPGIL